MSKITISFEGHINAAAQLIPAMTKLLAPTPLNITIEDTATPAPAKRAPKKEVPVATASADDAEKKAQAKREAAKRHAEKKKAEKVAEPATAPAPAKAAKPAKLAEEKEITLTTLRQVAGKLPKTKLVPVLEELGVTKLTEIAEEDYGKAMAAFMAASE